MSLNLAGQVFGRLTVLEKAEPYVWRGQRSSQWKVSCACGEVRVVMQQSLRNGKSQSCGCLRVERARASLVNTIDDLFPLIVFAANGCWEWIGFINEQGYGKVTMSGRTYRTHRIMYEHFRGRIPPGLPLDHEVCDNRACCNPWHVEPKTHRDNILRGTGATARNARKTHCPQGHPYAGENLVMKPERGRLPSRRCRTCSRDGARRERASA